jgi:hypothetical protein
MDEKDLISQIEILEKDLKLARATLAAAKKQWIDAETDLINKKIQLERAQESLRIFRATSPIQEKTMRDSIIDEFRDNYPELVAMAKKRDLEK